MSHSGAAIFKKDSGIITINEDASPAELTWRSTDGDKTYAVVLDTIDKLQATPSISEKMMLRLIGKVDEAKKIKDNEGTEVSPKPITHMFSFNNRTVMDNIKITLQHIISRYKDADIYEEKTRKEAESGVYDGPSMPSAPLINTTKLDDSLSSEKLLINFKLQQTLLRENKNLMRTFQETVINSGLPPEQFWSTRVSLLRAFALSTSQKVGPYNVLSTVKPVASSDNKVNVNISREKILSIFQNFPIAKKAYTDNVPKNFKEPEFWARFFSSKLFRKLRGERINVNDRGDVIIDRYLTLDQDYDRQDDISLTHPVRRTIDIDGNVQDDPVLKGNNPDMTMQPGKDVNGQSDGVVDILRGMNRLSKKMTVSLENEYSRVNLLNDENDREEWDELKFNDLNATQNIEYSLISLKNQPTQRLTTDEMSKNIKVDNKQVGNGISSVMNKLIGKLDLTQVVTSGEKANEINQSVINAVKINAKQAKHNNVDNIMGTFVGGNSSHISEAKTDIPIELLDSCRLLHGTCGEFLKHFYIYFQSGEPKNATTVRKLYSNLKQCSDKITELLDDVHQGDGEEMSRSCKTYLQPVLTSITLAIQKYDEIAEFVNIQATPVN